MNPCAAGTGGATGVACNILPSGSRTPIAGNNLTGLLDPAFTALVTSPLYPVAAGTPLGSGFGTATNIIGQQYNTDQGDIKIDYNISEKDHINARYSKMDEYDPQTNSQPLLGNSLSVDWINSGSVNWTHTFTPNLLSEMRFGKNGIKLIAPTETFDSSVGSLANTIGIIDGGDRTGSQACPHSVLEAAPQTRLSVARYI